jgi:hypothetical protein
MQVGLLKNQHMDQLPALYGYYKSESYLRTASVFKRQFCISVTIEFLGVWQVPTF